MCELTERQKSLGKFLINNKDSFILRKELLNFPEIRLLYFDETDSYKGIYFKLSARNLTRDIQVLNENIDFPYVIISDSYKGIKIATNKEDFEYLKKEKINLEKRWARFNIKKNKVEKLKENNNNLFKQLSFDFETNGII